MSAVLLSFALKAMEAVAPNRDHEPLATAIVDAVDSGPAFFADDVDKKKTVSLAIAVAYREGSLGTHVEGDFRNGKPTSWCSFQVNLGEGHTREGWTGPELRDDVVKCATVGVRMLRESVRVDPKAPVAFFAMGPAWKSERAQRISRDRVWLAKKLYSDAAAALARESTS